MSAAVYVLLAIAAVLVIAQVVLAMTAKRPCDSRHLDRRCDLDDGHPGPHVSHHPTCAVWTYEREP